MKKFFITITLILIIAGAGTGIYFVFFTPQARATRTAEQTMHAASSQDEASFKSHGTPSGSDEFYTAVSSRNYRLDTTAEEASTFYLRYSFTDNESPKHARIAIQNGIVKELAVGDAIGVTPKEDKKQAANTTSQDFCLAKADLQYLDATSLYARTIRGATMIFADDTSTTYSGEENAGKLFDRMGDFYKKTSAKDYSFSVRGYLAATSDTLEERKQVIQNRVTKIQQDLIKQGIPEDRINLADPVAYPADQPTDGQNERYVIIDITNNCIK